MSEVLDRAEASQAEAYVEQFAARGYPVGYSESKVRAIVAVCDKAPDPGLRWLPFFALESLIPVMRRFLQVPEVVDDIARANPGQWLAAHYCNPYNMVFEVAGGDGFIAFLRTFPGWKTQVYFAAWGVRAKGLADVWKHAARVAMLTWDLHVIEGFIREENIKSQRVALRTGMQFRGIIRPLDEHGNEANRVVWFEIDRKALGLPCDEMSLLGRTR